MDRNPLERVTTLTFDVFGTILDPSESLVPAASRFLRSKGVSIESSAFCARWFARQRIEQLQETLMRTGHTGYLEVSRRALVYSLRGEGVEFTEGEVSELMKAWEELSPFEDAVQALNRLSERYRLAVLSNGNPWLLKHLLSERVEVSFDAVVSVQEAGAFKPHPSVYRTAARILESEPDQIMMVTAHSIDVIGARSCGYRGAFVNRYKLPFEETIYQPGVTTCDLRELASYLLDG